MDQVADDRPSAALLDAARIVADPELAAATLAVFQPLELDPQLDVLVRHAVAWSGAGCGLGLAPAEDRRTLLVPVVGTVDAQDPRRAALGRIEAERLRRWAGPPGRWLHDGFGPLAEFAPDWPGPPPRATGVLDLGGPAGTLGAALLLTFDAVPPASGLERAARLIELARPAVANAFRVRAIRDLVIKDDTAHCFNRRYFENRLPEEIARASRFGTPLSLIFLDMDNLKEVNKQHGHAMGSRTLSEVSRRIRGKIRRFDRLFRFGGDEFCILLPETDWHGALEVAERVRDAIARQPFLATEVRDGAGVRMTASLGIAAFPLHARTQQELIEQSDRAMQRIKNGTKNSIGIAEILGDADGP